VARKKREGYQATEWIILEREMNKQEAAEAAEAAENE
jgi:hypothetical protein